MNHDTPANPKFAALQTVLGLPRYQIIGILESLWILTRTSKPRGDIGGYSNERIAASIGWQDDPDALVSALVVTGWLDEHPEHRLVVHDWEHHAPQYLKRRMARTSQEFAVTSHDYTVTSHGRAVASHDVAVTSISNITEHNRTEHNKDSRAIKESDNGLNKDKISRKADPELDAAVKEVVNSWNEMAAKCGLSQAQRLSDSRKRAIKARLGEAYFREFWREAIAQVPSSDFLCGRIKDARWTADLDFFVRPDSVGKIIEGKYHKHRDLTGQHVGDETVPF